MPARSRSRSSADPAERPREEPGARPRVTEVDVLRGFALFGVVVVNTVGITGMPVPAPDADPGPVYWAYETLLHQRFFPIFSLLFGLSFGLFLDSVRDRTPNPRLLMLARLGFLIPIGALHRVFQPREVLLTYAVVGIAVLLPASFVPGRRVLLALGLAATGTAAATVGGSTLIPGFFLLGFALHRYGVENLQATPARRLAAAFLASLALATALNAWQVLAAAAPGSVLADSAGIMTASAYGTAVLLALRSRAGRLLRGLAPLGRTALTGYVGATFAIIAADRFVRLGASPDLLTAVALGTSVFLLALAFAHLWLRFARYGPLEWLWRCLTWWSPRPPRTRCQRFVSGL
ncbi:DUF418 domain-containing protein [Actinomadura sp. WMMB 499]|uniref:DUF418 domain-containing protein n=1 Tax=Actinomadura sp. WMMB 499 TaxID=1219491 RepID=UPI0012451495|nr:DUF418 domain-containing protein [Actinomadura sp. WMMB 499]QFG23485.1 DUF418 domain-containing protein [Actinomadura sp. WMMB 499]